MAISMPIQQAIPIETKGLSFWPALWLWLTTTRQWLIVEDYDFVVDGVLIRIPKGFIYDGATSYPWLISRLRIQV